MTEWPNGGMKFPKADIRCPLDFEQMAKLVRPEDFKGRLVISEDPDVHRAEIQRYVDLGIDRVYLHNVGGISASGSRCSAVTSFLTSPADSMETLPPSWPLEPHGPVLTERCEPVQFLTAGGELTATGRQADVSLLQAQGFYRDMVRARRLDEEALALQRQGELGLWLMSLGQEAAQVGSIRALEGRDYVFPTYREHAAALCRGIGPTELLVQWRGNQHCGWDPHDYRFHFYSLVLGAQTLHATGYAMGVQRDRAREVVMTYLGDGASSQGDVSEALGIGLPSCAPQCSSSARTTSGQSQLPHQPRARHPCTARAAGFGLDTYVVDGNDVLAVHAVTQAAAERVRNGGGPSFIEAVTYRMAGGAQLASDDPTRYRPHAEVEAWRQRDPIARLRTFLEGAGVEPEFFRRDFEGGRPSRIPGQGGLPVPRGTYGLEQAFDTVYVEAHASLEAERAEFVAYTSTFLKEDFEK